MISKAVSKLMLYCHCMLLFQNINSRLRDVKSSFEFPDRIRINESWWWTNLICSDQTELCLVKPDWCLSKLGKLVTVISWSTEAHTHFPQLHTVYIQSCANGWKLILSVSLKGSKCCCCYSWLDNLLRDNHKGASERIADTFLFLTFFSSEESEKSPKLKEDNNLSWI